MLPTKVEYHGDKQKGEIIIEPCSPGYGTTWGNALRRVLFSSLSGAAITAVKIRGIKHEFSTIPGIKEDTLEIILNLKQVRLKVFTDDEIKLSLNAKGDGKVYAKNFGKNSQVEIINPDLLLATLTDKKAKLEMEVWVKRGRGYLTVEERKNEEKEVGKILIDSIFTPIFNVGLKLDNVRVGEKTNLDRLTIPIETDGTITPVEAFIEAARLLKDHFIYISKKLDELVVSGVKDKKAKIVKVVKKTVKKKVVKKITKKSKNK
ncbi:MAG: DNA-directed RNA polymerase subunit alpha [Ignavibacterium sp.]|nr:DNA-directed RNA polymerase subunit alpha [Ignavibacterium sp.]